MRAFRSKTGRAVCLGYAGALALGVLGCNSLLGIEKAELDPQTAGGGGSTASGGSAGVGGSGGSNAGGGLGAGGSDPGRCEDFATTDEDLVRGCVMRVSCEPGGSYYTMSDCVGYGYQLINPYEDCTFGANDCSEVELCLGTRALSPAQCGPAQGQGWFCSGAEAVQCGESGGVAIDCAWHGSLCTETPGFPIFESTAPCLVDLQACDDALGAWRCDGDILYQCIDGQRYGRDCAAASGTCVETQLGQAYCFDSRASCDALGTVGCDGDVLSYCGEVGLLTELDCSAVGLHCESDGVAGACVASACTLSDVGNCTEGCDGSRLRYCAGGAPQEVDCTAYGFDSCQQSDLFGFTTARCAYVF